MLESVLEKVMATHSGTLAWKIPWMEESGGLQSMGWLWVGHNWVTSLSLFTFMHWRKKWQPTPVFLPGESQGWGSLVGCCLRVHRVGHYWSNLAAAAESVQFNSVAQRCPTLCGPMDCSTSGFHVYRQLLELAQIYVHQDSDAIQTSHLLLSPSLLPSIFPSIRVFSKESVLCIRWPKYWGFSLSISPSNEYPGRISFRMDWFDLLAVQGTLKSLLQHHSSKASILHMKL